MGGEHASPVYTPPTHLPTTQPNNTTPPQFKHVLNLFIPAWLSARSAEVFKVATIWAMKMQYGGGKGSLGLL